MCWGTYCLVAEIYAQKDHFNKALNVKIQIKHRVKKKGGFPSNWIFKVELQWSNGKKKKKEKERGGEENSRQKNGIQRHLVVKPLIAREKISSLEMTKLKNEAQGHVESFAWRPVKSDVIPEPVAPWLPNFKVNFLKKWNW